MEKNPKLINVGPTFIPDYRVGIQRLIFDFIWVKNVQVLMDRYRVPNLTT